MAIEIMEIVIGMVRNLSRVTTVAAKGICRGNVRPKTRVVVVVVVDEAGTDTGDGAERAKVVIATKAGEAEDTQEISANSIIVTARTVTQTRVTVVARGAITQRTVARPKTSMVAHSNDQRSTATAVATIVTIQISVARTMTSMGMSCSITKPNTQIIIRRIRIRAIIPIIILPTPMCHRKCTH